MHNTKHTSTSLPCRLSAQPAHSCFDAPFWLCPGCCQSTTKARAGATTGRGARALDTTSCGLWQNSKRSNSLPAAPGCHVCTIMEPLVGLTKDCRYHVCTCRCCSWVLTLEDHSSISSMSLLAHLTFVALAALVASVALAALAPPCHRHRILTSAAHAFTVLCCEQWRSLALAMSTARL
jgi:hypothetical protein